MTTIEIEASIVDHRLDIRSDLLPASADRARVIVMVDESSARSSTADILARAHAAQASFPRRPAQTLAQELRELRAEWSREL